MKIKKILNISVAFVLILYFPFICEAGLFKKQKKAQQTDVTGSRTDDEKYRKMFAQQELIDKGHAKERELNFEEALMFLEKSITANYTTVDRDRTYSLISIFRIQTFRQDYDNALFAANEYLRIEPRNYLVEEQKKKIEALIEWKKTGNKNPVYDWIEMMKQKHAQWLPPQRIVFHSTGILIQFVELYDLLGDYDAAIEYIQPFLKRHQGVRNNDYKINEHLGLIQALNESKQGQPKICIEDGKVCLGRATAYIIKSKSF